MPNNEKAGRKEISEAQGLTPKAQTCSEESIPFSPGWGPTFPLANKEGENENAEIHSKTEFLHDIPTKEKDTVSESLPYPPGWGTTPKYIFPHQGQKEVNTQIPEANQEKVEETQVQAMGEKARDREERIQNLKSPVTGRHKGKGRKKRKSSPLPRQNSKIRKRAEKREEAKQLRNFLIDMHSPEIRKGNRKSPRVSKVRKRNLNKKEAEEVVKMGCGLGLLIAAPAEIIVERIEALLDNNQVKEVETRRGTDFVV